MDVSFIFRGCFVYLCRETACRLAILSTIMSKLYSPTTPKLSDLNIVSWVLYRCKNRHTCCEKMQNPMSFVHYGNSPFTYVYCIAPNFTPSAFSTIWSKISFFHFFSFSIFKTTFVLFSNALYPKRFISCFSTMILCEMLFYTIAAKFLIKIYR